jgi:hypothetical protein
VRATIVIVASIAGLVAGAATVRAADLPLESSGYGGCCYVGPVAPLVILDTEPGVVVRRWWLPPWRDRHYYPHGIVKLKTAGRHHADRSRPRRAPSYARYWTNPPVYLLDSAPLLKRDGDLLPRPRPSRYRPPAVVAP